MTNAEQLVQVLSDHLHKRKTSVKASPELLASAGIHEVEAIVYRQTRAPELEKSYYAALYEDRRRRKYDREIRSALREGGADCFSVKGLFVADYYPEPALRTMGDLDIVVRDRDLAKEILERAGYTFSEKAETTDWHFFKGGLDFELHDRLLYGGRFETDEKRIQYFNDCWKYYRDGEISPDFHFLFLVMHLRKHMLGGVGFRLFLDLAVMVKNASGLFDWAWIRGELERIGLLKFAEVCFALNRQWFEVEPPFPVPELSEDFVRRATEKICANGVFGYDSEEYEARIARAMGESTEKGYKAEARKRFLERAFPSYEELSLFPEYSFLKGKKLLLPAAWVYRFSRNAFRRDKWQKLRGQASMQEEEFEARNRELREWGL